jgi:glycerol kinase
MTHILALDQGTTSSRAILFNAQGSAMHTAQLEFKQIFPQLGWVEHDPLEIWQAQLQVMKQVLAEAGPDQAVAAIAITNQRETTVLWDRQTGQPLANAIVWQDRRTVEHCNTLRQQGRQTLIQEKTGLVLDSYFSGTKLAWLLENTPGARARAERGELAFGTIDSWLVWNLTKGRAHVTDPSNASRTLLFNLHTLAWDDELLALFNIPRSLLPKVVPSSGVVAATDPTWLGRAIPIASMIGDQQAATFGQACFEPGMAKNTYGTGCFMLLNTGHQPVASQNKLLTTVGWQRLETLARSANASDASKSHTSANTNADINSSRNAQRPAQTEQAIATTYCLEASVFMGGATIQWLRDGLNIISSAAEVEALAASVPDVADTYLIPAFTGLGAPNWDGNARGTLIGMTRGTTKAHIARAALEAIALQVADVFDAMAKDSGIALAELRVDGGASKNNLLMQIQADLLGVPVVRPKITETTALGAAYLAGLAIGLWSSTEEIARQWSIDRRFEPNMAAADRQAKLARWHQALERAKGWAT